MKELAAERELAQLLHASKNSEMPDSHLYQHPVLMLSRFWQPSDKNATLDWFDDYALRAKQTYIFHARRLLGPQREATARQCYQRPLAGTKDIQRVGNTIILYCRLVELGIYAD
jgi:hypothetical protein